jgi:beta-galactosidase
VLGVPPIDGVEIVVRRGHGADYLFVLNHYAPRVIVRGPGHDLLSSASAQNGIAVAQGDVAVLRTNDASANAGWVVSK